MVKSVVSLSVFFLVAVTGKALAINCAASTGYTRVAGDGDVLKNTLSGKTACKANTEDWEWQEYHEPSGTLIDWKKGPSDPVDPSVPVGKWSATDGASAEVTYSYDTKNYTYNVWKTKLGLYDFCAGSTVKVRAASLMDGQDSCQ